MRSARVVIFNQAAMDVMANHPDILINDLNAAVRNSSFYGAWNQEEDVHFMEEAQRREVGEAADEAIRKGLES